MSHAVGKLTHVQSGKEIGAGRLHLHMLIRMQLIMRAFRDPPPLTAHPYPAQPHASPPSGLCPTTRYHQPFATAVSTTQQHAMTGLPIPPHTQPRIYTRQAHSYA